MARTTVVAASGEGRCSTHGRVEGVPDSVGRLRCPTRGCAKILAVGSASAAANPLTTVEIVSSSDLVRDPLVARYQKALAITRLDRDIREASAPVLWQEELAKVREQLGDLDARLSDLNEWTVNRTLELDHRLERVESRINALYDFQAFRKAFTCRGCGSTGTIALRVRCKCGSEDWLGWMRH